MAGVKEGMTVMTMAIALEVAKRTVSKLQERGVLASEVNGIDKLDPQVIVDLIGRSIVRELKEGET